MHKHKSSKNINIRNTVVGWPWSAVRARVNNPDRSGQTAALRYRFTGPVWPETGWIQIQIQNRMCNRFDQFTGRVDRFEFKSKFKIACVTGLERYTSQFDQFTKWVLMGRLIFFLFFFGLTLNARKVC